MNAFSIEFGGLTFLLVGFALAEARAAQNR